MSKIINLLSFKKKKEKLLKKTTEDKIDDALDEYGSFSGKARKKKEDKDV